MPGNHAAATVNYPYGYAETDVHCSDNSSYTLKIPAPSQSFTIPANNNSLYPSATGSTTNPGCSNGAPGQTTGGYFFALGIQNPGGGNPGLTGFTTTDGSPATAQTDPLNVTFNIADSSTGQGGVNAPMTTLNRQNPYSCTPPGCPLTPIITWATPSNIAYPAQLNSAQLDATASAMQIAGMQTAGSSGLETTVSVPGTFVYTPAAGTVLHPGTYTLSTTFTPTAVGSAYGNFTIATAAVPITVSKATPVITWAAPGTITYPTPLSSTQLDATASVPGTFVYTPAAGTVLNPGTYTLSTTFTPTDTVDYATVTATVPITVNGNSSMHPPTAVLTGSPISGTAPLTVNFSGAGSSDPNPDGTITSYTFSFGDGSAPVTQSSPTITHTYTAAATYTAMLTVTDNYGAVSSASSVAITVSSTGSAQGAGEIGEGEYEDGGEDEGDAHFAFNVDNENGAPHGNLDYSNHAAGLSVESTSITSFSISGTSATFGGTCVMNGNTPCTFQVTAVDNDNQKGDDDEDNEGRGTDVFTISVSGHATQTAVLDDGSIEVKP